MLFTKHKSHLSYPNFQLRYHSDHIESKKDGKDQETIQLSTKPDPGYHMGK